ncbi:MAG: type I-E CRISPR-associated protein Cas7/Cse4/CasC [bacterium]
MIVELHIIQNFAPSNLNRDDANAPKDCEFGGYRRARISSQCIKRSVRKHPAFARAIEQAGGTVGVRTKRIKSRLKQIFTDEFRRPTEEAEKVSVAVIELLGLKLSDTEKTEYLLYLGENEVAEIAKTANDSWDMLLTDDREKAKEEGEEKGKKKGKSPVPEHLEELKKSLVSVISKSRKEARSYAADVALFGRMVADNKNMSVDAACQVAHAISTHKVEMEMDYFTAVDDLLPGEETGSDMIGVVEFNSSCFYRYSLINIEKLRENLGLNDDLLKASVIGFIEVSIQAIPTGKQNSMAAQNPAGFARVIVKKDGAPWSLANAFQKPVYPGKETDCSLEERSIAALNSYYESLKKIYGRGSVICDSSFNLYDEKSLSLEQMLRQVSDALRSGVSA